MKMNRFFAPAINSASANLGLLILRIWFGGTMLLIHGWDKVAHFSDKAKDFPDLLHLGSPTANLVLAIFAEVVCAGLLVMGFVTRFAALTLAINMAVAFALVHHMKLTGEHNGELAFLYLAGYVTLLITGPGRLSVDAAVFGGKSAS